MKTINTIYEGFNSLSIFVLDHQPFLCSQENSALLVQVFSGQSGREDLERLLAEIRGLLPKAIILGTTTSGEIIDGQVTGLKTVLSFSFFRKTKITAGLFTKDRLNDVELGIKIGTALNRDKAKLFILFSTGGTIHSNSVLKGIESVCPGIPVAGGNAGRSAMGGFVCCNETITSCGVAGVVLEGDIVVHCYSHLGWQPIGKEMTITKADGVRVYSIDNIPAFQVYNKYLGLDRIQNFSNAVEYPLIGKRDGCLMARTPDTYYEDDSIAFAAEFVEGEKVRLSFGDVGLISEAIAGLCQEIKQKPAESIFIYSCECRRGFLQELSKIEIEPLQEITNTAGFFTYGEFYWNKRMNQLLNATMTVVVLAEEEKSKTGQSKLEEEIRSTVYRSPRDKVVERRTGVLKALTHLINTVTDELTTANGELTYTSQHDSLSGLYNRTFFEMERKRLQTVDYPIGIMICDLDCLKTVNDILGHSFGDKMISMAAKIITESCEKGDIVARIGGDEFAIILLNTSLSAINTVRKRIITAVANQRREQPDSFLYLSIGFALTGNSGARNLDDAFKIADKNMYSHKAVNRRYVQKAILRKLAAIQ